MTSHLSLSILCFPSCAMARLSGAGLGLLKCTLLLLGLSGGLCQHDCTGVDCPVLSHCIREVLESGACCPSCVKGCTCEGYQYYDCVNAGFQNGKVPEGDSYFVDYGSTECSCPEGGGRISCHYISCPEIPANCIEMSEPEDSCAQCERIGCVRDTQKFDAGHSFHVDPCRVCHCPSEGGELMCYSVPDCDPRGAGQSMPTAPTEHSIQYGDTYRFDQQSPPHGHPPSGNLPIFKPAPNDRMDLEDYDYEHADVPEFGDETPDFPTQSPPLGMAFPLSHGPDRAHRTPLAQGVGRGSKLELRERYGVHEHPTDRIQATESPAIAEYSVTTAAAHMRLSYSPPLHSPNGSRNHISTLQPLRTTNSQITPQVAIVRPMLTESSSDKIIFPLHRSSGSQNHPPFLLQRNSESSVHPQRTPERKKHTDNLVIPLNPLKGPESLPPSIHPVPEKEHQAHPVSHSITVKHPLHPLVGSPDALDPTQSPSHGQTLMQSAVAPDMHSPDEYSVDEEETEEEEEEEEEERIVTLRESTPGPDGRDVPYRVKSHAEEEDERFSHSVAEGSPLEPSTESPRGTERPTTPAAVLLTTTAQPMLRAKVITQEEGHPGKRWPQTQFDPRGEDLQDVEEEEKEPREEEGSKDSSLFRPDPNGAADPGPGVSDGLLVEDCCVVGQRWATEKGHCSHMPPLSSDKLSICSVAQHQCCASSLKESLCVSGVASARAGEVCRVEAEDQCRDDSHQVCCSCCALGLRLRREGQGCSGHQYLGYPCGHIFLTCCEAEDGPGQVLLRRKEQPRPTAMPTEVPVSDRKFPKEAFSIDSTVDEKANVVDEEEDVDECQLYRGQLCQHICTNTWGSYLCSCHHGYVLQEDGHSCTSVSPGEDNRVREGDIHSIVPGPATTATTTTTSTPVYFNACTGGGPCSQQCTLMSGQATCSCFPGFSLTADKHTCEDVDECVTNTHSCGLRERCVNTVGSHMCERQLSCRPGYQPRHGVCEDIDECMVRIHNCGIGFECKNTEGSFLCKPKQKCLTGFKQDSHGNCIDINECSTLSESCSPGFNCINTVGSYTCQRKVIKCNHGYQPSPDGAKCIDVDECQMGTHRCGTEQICHNLPGSYSCDCRTGFQYDAIRQVCNDVNECWRYPGRLCAQTCENTPGSYQCTCTAGFSLAFDGKNCEDINECDRSPCSQECANIYGSYQCYCRQGFHLKEDGHTCEDIDECSQSIGNLCAFECVNVPGSYQCACPPHGYTKSANGRTCRDIDECTSQSHNCSHGQSCYNIQGSYRCLSYDCPPNYKKVSDTRCERLGCPGNSADCQSSPLRITYYQLNFQTNILTPAQVFRIGPSPAYSGDHIVIGITRGNEEGYFSTRKLNSFTGAVYLQRQVRQTKDFLIDVEMKLLRQGSVTSFVARIYVFITAGSP